MDIFYIHTDHLNTPKKVSRPSDNKLRWRWDSSPFGTIAPNENPASLGTFAVSLRMAGQIYFGEAGLHYNNNRDYDPTTGRYVQSDPIGLNAGINTYSYVGASPLQRIDPLGLAEIEIPVGRVICTGGKPVPDVKKLSPLEERCGVSDCIYKHEMSHVADYNRFSKRICRYLNEGQELGDA